MFRLTRSSEFPRSWVIVSPGCSEKNTVPPVTREVTEYPYMNWCPPCLSFVRFILCWHCLCICSFVPCHWNAGLLCLVGLKEYGLGTQSLGRWIVHCSRLELHRLIIRTWHTAWRPETITTSFANGPVNKTRLYVLAILISSLRNCYRTNEYIKSDNMC